MKINQLLSKKIIVIGLGKEGFSALKFLVRIKHPHFMCADQCLKKNLLPEIKDFLIKNKINFQGGKNYLKDLKKFEVIIKSPGIPLKKFTKSEKEKIILSTDIFLANVDRSKVIGITGTKGKSTTCHCLYQFFKAAKIAVNLAGNIGQSVFDFLPLNSKKSADIFIIELSSFQLEKVHNSPHIAAITSFFPDHLDHHQTLSSYQKAKENIFAFQQKGDFLLAEKKFLQKNKIIKGVKKIALNQEIEIKKNAFYFQQKKIAESKNLTLIGKVNLKNLALAIAIAKIFNIKNNIIQKTLPLIKPLTHRLNFIGQKKGIEFWNNSIAVNPTATLEDLKFFKSKIGTLFLGGADRFLDFSFLAQEIIKLQIPVLIFFPSAGKRIWQEIKKASLKINPHYQPLVLHTKEMSRAIDFTLKNCPFGKIALLSPACSSFSLWKNFQERGNDFQKCFQRHSAQ